MATPTTNWLAPTQRLGAGKTPSALWRKPSTSPKPIGTTPPSTPVSSHCTITKVTGLWSSPIRTTARTHNIVETGTELANPNGESDAVFQSKPWPDLLDKQLAVVFV